MLALFTALISLEVGTVYIAISMQHLIRTDSSSCVAQVFAGEGFKNPKDERHCVNSVSIKYVKE